jgi:hypothetical protein
VVESAIGLLLAASALFLNLFFFRHAGPLWRDELVSLHTSQVPFHALLERMQFDSYPAFWLLVVRTWVACFGFHLQTLRLLGLLTGIALLVMIFITLRELGLRVPMLAIALGAATVTTIRYGDSLRAYGFSAVVGLLSLTLIHRTLRKPSAASFALAALASLASVHTTYYNCLLLLACCAGGLAAHASLGRLRDGLKLFAIGAVCATSMLIYLPTWRAVARWSDVTRYDVDLPWLWHKFGEAVPLTDRVWIALFILACGIAIACIVKNVRRVDMLFCSTTLVLLAAVHLAFLWTLRYLMQPWYFLLPLVVAAVLIDAIMAIAFEQDARLQLVRGVAAIAITALTFTLTLSMLTMRSTNIDRIAAVVAQQAAPSDLIVIYPWYLGVSFNTYYRGRAAWQTLPPIADQSVQRYDDAKIAMTHPEREDVLLARVAETLRRGDRVWYAGFPLFEESGAFAGTSNHPGGMVAADLRWSSKFRELLAREAKSQTLVVEQDGETIWYERAMLTRFSR